MGQSVQSITGVHDILPQSAAQWHHFENHIRQLMQVYGYGEMRTPILEKTELFKRSIGEVTDIVEKEMYTFCDRDGDMLSLRPENTAGCVRAAIQHGMLTNNQVSRIWYLGPMFRRERPQAGRYRQFWQVGAEVYGVPGPHIEAELILLSAALWRRLQISDAVKLQINSLGSSDDRAAYRKVLVEYLSAHHDQLDEDSQRRLQSNPLRILDSKNPELANLIEQAPKLPDSLCTESRDHFAQLCETLESSGVDYSIDTRLVRGLDYYSHTVFEWVTEQLGSQGTVCAGGRYDGLTEQLGAKLTPGVGWALGVERLLLLGEGIHGKPESQGPDVFMVLAGEPAVRRGLVLAEQLRAENPGMSVVCNCAGGSMKSQFKRADRSAAAVALVLGETELAQQTVTVKPLLGQAQQSTVGLNQLNDELSRILANVPAASSAR